MCAAVHSGLSVGITNQLAAVLYSAVTVMVVLLMLALLLFFSPASTEPVGL